MEPIWNCLGPTFLGFLILSLSISQKGPLELSIDSHIGTLFPDAPICTRDQDGSDLLPPLLQEASYIHYVKQLTDDCINKLQQGICVGLLPHQILMQMHIDDSGLLFTSQNLYNSKIQIYCKQFNARTSIQVLIN